MIKEILLEEFPCDLFLGEEDVDLSGGIEGNAVLVLVVIVVCLVVVVATHWTKLSPRQKCPHRL